MNRGQLTFNSLDSEMLKVDPDTCPPVLHTDYLWLWAHVTSSVWTNVWATPGVTPGQDFTWWRPTEWPPAKAEPTDSKWPDGSAERAQPQVPRISSVYQPGSLLQLQALKARRGGQRGKGGGADLLNYSTSLQPSPTAGTKAPLCSTQPH